MAEASLKMTRRSCGVRRRVCFGHIYIHVYIYIHIYIYIERERTCRWARETADEITPASSVGARAGDDAVTENMFITASVEYI